MSLYYFFWVFFSGSSTVAIDNKIEQAMVSIVVHKTRERGHRGSDRMVVEFTTTYAISAYHH